VSGLAFAAAGPSAYWYLARASGAVALLLLTASVVLGVLGSLRVGGAPRWPRFAVDAIHRDVSLLVLALLVVHIATSIIDAFAPISLLDSVIPFGSSYRPVWLGLGALSFDLLVALAVTSVARRRLGYRSWRAIHWLAYASWPVAVFHGLGTGSDTKSWWMLALTALCVAAVLAAVLARIAGAAAGPQANRVRGPAIATSAALAAGLVVFTAAGPLQRGWARRAGTPASLLTPRSSSSVAVSTVRRSPARARVRPFSAALSGTISQSEEPGGEIVDLSLGLSGGARGDLRIRLAGAPEPGGGLSMVGSQVDLAAAGFPAAMTGKVVSLQGGRIDARVSDSSGSRLRLRADLNIDDSSGTVTGSLLAVRGHG
jgi:hypothetical protein